MAMLRLGKVDFLNCLPVYHAMEEGLLPLDAHLLPGPPTKLNRLFLAGELDITPISSIEFARHADKCVILPNMSISSDGPVASVLLFSKVPPTELDGKKVCLTSYSATSVVLLKILFQHYYHVDVEYFTSEPDLNAMMGQADAALIIGDGAMQATCRVREEKLPYYITDLGEAWKQFTGEKMVFALWVIRRAFAKENPAEVDRISDVFYQSKILGMDNVATLVEKGRKRTGLPQEMLQEYFVRNISHEFGEDYRRALLTYYDYAYKSGLIDERVRLTVWGEDVV